MELVLCDSVIMRAEGLVVNLLYIIIQVFGLRMLPFSGVERLSVIRMAFGCNYVNIVAETCGFLYPNLPSLMQPSCVSCTSTPLVKWRRTKEKTR